MTEASPNPSFQTVAERLTDHDRIQLEAMLAEAPPQERIDTRRFYEFILTCRVLTPKTNVEEDHTE